MDVIEMLSQAMEQPKGTLTGFENLSELEALDSLAVLKFMALVDANCGIILSPETFFGCNTVNDVAKFLGETARRRP
jgi:acyl carrier protein